MSELQNSVMTKKIELEHLKRTKNLFAILDTQVRMILTHSVLNFLFKYVLIEYFDA